MVFLRVLIPKFVINNVILLTIILMDNTSKIRLSAKELSILHLIASGQTSPQIAERLCLSVPTIKWYRKKLKAKFDVETTVQMIRKAIDQDLI